MRTFKQFTTDLVRTPPLLFPLVGLFHVLWLAWVIWDDRHEPFPDIAWLQVLWMAGYAVFWLAACDMRKWGALGYIALTIADACIYFAIMNQKLPREYLSNIFLMDGLFSFFLVFYYRRFNS